MINKYLKLQRNILLASTGSLLLTNILIAVKFYNFEVVTRNLPFSDEELIISKTYINDAALKLKADQILNLIFSIKRENIEKVTELLLRQVDNEFYQEFKQKIQTLTDDILKRDYRYIFSDIQKYEYDNFNYTVKVTGFLDTYLSDKQIANKKKQYLLSFTNRAGIINLKSFEEVEDENGK